MTFTSEGVAKDAVEKLNYTMLDCEALLREAEDKEQNMAATVGKEGGSVNKRNIVSLPGIEPVPREWWPWS